MVIAALPLLGQFQDSSQGSIPLVGRLAKDHAKRSHCSRKFEVLRSLAVGLVTVSNGKLQESTGFPIGSFVAELKRQQLAALSHIGRTGV